MKGSKLYDIIIVGSGLYGSTFANLANRSGKKCLVLEKRNNLGGNIYCEPLDVGNGDVINVHKYGAHIFHTSDIEIWEYVNSFVHFKYFINSPLANYYGTLFNLPFNMNTFYQMWGTITPDEAKRKIEEQKLSCHIPGDTTPKNLEEKALSLVGTDIYEKLIKHYTEKQWGRKCCDLPPFIISRLPVRFTYDNNYFIDTYQGIPVGGYNRLINGLLKNVDCLTSTDFFKSKYLNWRSFADTLVYTGPIDEYFSYKLGNLEWRSLKFKTIIKEIPNFQGNAVVNYTSPEKPFTRIIEHKHFEMQGSEVYACPKTVISEEYPIEYKDGNERFYPINDKRNMELLDKYLKLTKKEENVIFGGRLGTYKYYDMAPVIRKAFDDFKNYEESNRHK